MAEYIEREALINELSACCMPIDDREISGLFDCDESIRDIIDAMPAADVRPERHGEWLYCGDGYECSECGGGSVVNTNPYCWKCGAKMDGSGKSDNWISTSEQLPPENQIVDTKIDDEKGARNEQELVFSHNF